MDAQPMSVFDYAIKMEQDGAALYSEAARNLEEAAIKSFLSALATEEERHAAMLLKLKEKIQKKRRTTYFKDENVDDYLQSLIASDYFDSVNMQNPRVTFSSVEAVYKIAIRAERSSIMLYESILDKTKDKGLRTALKAMIRDEKNHLTKIVALRADRDNLFAVERFGCLC